MWSYIIIIIASGLASILALFSGFGLGTVLLPVFAFFVPLQVAVAATAIVHMIYNISRSTIVGKSADWKVVLKFALPAALTAMIGAFLLNRLSGVPTILKYSFSSFQFELNIIKITIGLLLIFSATFNLIPGLKNISFKRKYLPLGGVITGFMGGLSGLQGAWRSAFLIKSGLNKDAYIGTSAISSIIVDFSRLIIYGISFYTAKFTTLPKNTYGIVTAAVLSALVGSITGNLVAKKITIRVIKLMVGIMLIVIGIGLISGLI